MTAKVAKALDAKIVAYVNKLSGIISTDEGTAVLEHMPEAAIKA
ncbi:MAG: hypothetical protein PHC64_08225 [Candidatus Gastranaerophilales bacterium]|nr:hypothetical protein [Candidatus Gastranaerophilales bacterium]